MKIKGRYSLLAAAFALTAFQANAVNVTVAYQTSAEPAIAILASKRLPESGGDILWASGIAAYHADYYPARRVMHRATILGDAPY